MFSHPSSLLNLCFRYEFPGADLLCHMRMNRTSKILAVAGAAIAVAVPMAAYASGGSSSHDRTDAAKHAIVGGKARNVIMFLGDGMGDSEITIARNYQVGADGRLSMDTLPLTGEYTTYAVQKANPTQAGLRDRLGRLRLRLGHRSQDLQRRHLGAARRQAGADHPGTGQAGRLQDR